MAKNNTDYIKYNWTSLQTAICILDENMTENSQGRKYYGSRRNSSLRAISPFPTMFSKTFHMRRVKTWAYLEKAKRIRQKMWERRKYCKSALSPFPTVFCALPVFCALQSSF